MDPIVLLSNRGDLAPKKKGLSLSGMRRGSFAILRQRRKQHVQGLLAEDLHSVHPPSQGICSLLPFYILDDEVEVSLIERLSEAALRRDRAGSCWMRRRGEWVKLFKLLDVLFGVQDTLRGQSPHSISQVACLSKSHCSLGRVE